MLAYLLMLAATAAAPARAVTYAGTDHYFGSDASVSAEYLHLQADGHYAVVDVQHMFTTVADQGRWHVSGQSVVLESDYSVRDIELGDFRVYVFDRCGQEALPDLRAAIQKLRERAKLVSPAELDELDVTRAGHPLGRGPRKLCGASLGYSPNEYPAKPVPSERLDSVLAAIDAWLANATEQNIFEYQVWEYAGERFLAPMRSGMHAVQFSVSEVQEKMDRYSGERAPYVYYAISAREYAKHANCTYAFKFYPGMNAPCNRD